MKTKLILGVLLALLVLGTVCAASAADIEVPDDTLVIEREAFAGVGWHEYDDDEDRWPMYLSVRLPQGIKRIESRAFADSGIWHINLPDSLEYIADDAFEGCEIYASVKNGSYAQLYCARLNIAYAMEHNGDPTVVAAEEYANSTMTTITLPEGIRRIESRAFANSKLRSINFPDSLEYIAPDAFEGVELYYYDEEEGEDSAALEVEVFPDSVGETYCIEHEIPYASLMEPELFYVESEFDPLTEVTMLPGQVRDGYHSGLVLYQWGIGHLFAYDSVNGYTIDSFEISEAAQPYLTVSRSEELTGDAYLMLTASQDIPLGEDPYDNLFWEDAIKVYYTYRGQSLSRSLDVKVIHRTMTRFVQNLNRATINVPVDLRVEAWTVDENDNPLAKINSFTPHWAIDGIPVNDQGEAFDYDGNKIAQLTFEDGGALAHITWVTAPEDDDYEYDFLTCADDNEYIIAEAEVTVLVQ